MFNTEIHVSGPMFTPGAVEQITDDLARELAWDVGSQGLADVQRNLDRSIKHPTPYYEAQVMIQWLNRAASAFATMVHDRDIIYGPWLEGTGSRNKTTRFKGYASFRRAYQTLSGQVERIARVAVARTIARLNG